MAIGIAFFWLVIVVGIVALIQFSSRQSRMRAVRGHRYKGVSEQLLAIRFAHGEIDESEYRQRLAVLRGSVRR